MKEELALVILNAVKELGCEVGSVLVNVSDRPDLCDYQCNDLFKIAKVNGVDINTLGNSVVSSIKKLDNYSSYFKDIEFVKPGFLNIKASDVLIDKYIKKMLNNDKFGIDIDNSETFVIDFGGANVAKPLHVGHMRTAIVGESIKRIIEYKGHKTISDVHIGDYGLQIGEVIYGILEEGKALDEVDIAYLDYIYPYMSNRVKEDEDLKEKCATITKDLQDGNLEYKKIWKRIMEVSVKDIKKNYDFLDVSFDYWYGESDAYKYLDETEEILNSKGLLKESMGAMIVDVKEESDKKEIPPFIFKKSNGAYLYESTDLATILQRKKDFNPDHILYVVDNRQELHFERVFRTSEKSLIFPKEKLEFLGYGTVNGEDGKPYKTRSGGNPKLEGLFNDVKEIFISKKETNKDKSSEDIDIIVNSILKFADLQNSREKDYIFDINKFSDVVGKTGPYVVYTYLRLNKIIKDSKIDVASFTDKIYNEYDRDLRLKLLALSNAVNSAFISRKPSFIADYVYDLCTLANTFYEHNHINNLKDLVNYNDWLNVIRLTSLVIKDMLYLLGIKIPSEM